jgi:hypothetical protein
MTIADFTGLVTSAQVLDFIENMAIVFGGLIAVMILLSPAFLAKGGFKWIQSKVSSLFGSGR